MKKVAWAIGIYVFLSIISSRCSSNTNSSNVNGVNPYINRINPWTPLRAAYIGISSCPCPYDVAIDGSFCGDRSAYIRPGGGQPYCYYYDEGYR